MAIVPIDKSVSGNNIAQIQHGIKLAFDKVKEELDEHREAINDNTNELHSNYEHMMAMENKIDKLSQRIDELFLMFEDVARGQRTENKPLIGLTANEQKIFLNLYTQEESVSEEALARNLDLSVAVVEECVRSMSSKGINLTTAYRDGTAYIQLEPQFREHQAKNKIVQIRPVL